MTTIDPKYAVALMHNLTHQAINPLNSVIGTIDNILDGTISSNRRDQRLTAVRGQLEYTISLIRNLSYFATYGTDDSVEPQFKNTNNCIIPKILIEAAQFFQEQGAKQGIKLFVSNREDQNAVNGDSELLRQIFMNIFDNFIKYGEDNSTVEIKQNIQKATNILIITFEGRSIPFDDNEDIFALGFRSRYAIEKTSSGSGLGLFVCKRIVEKLFKGTITAQYFTNRKTAHFEIRIPSAFALKNERYT